MRRTTPPVAGAGRGAGCPTGPKRAGSGGRPRRAGLGGGGGVGDPPSSLDSLSGAVPYTEEEEEELLLDRAGGGGGRALRSSQCTAVILLRDLVIIFLFILPLECHYICMLMFLVHFLRFLMYILVKNSCKCNNITILK